MATETQDEFSCVSVFFKQLQRKSSFEDIFSQGISQTFVFPCVGIHKWGLRLFVAAEVPEKVNVMQIG